jgi:DNA-binding NarL/FixJ family response regulator
MSEPTLRLLIADDHPLFLQGLQSLFTPRHGVVVVAAASNGQEAVDLYRTHRPDVAILDVRMPVMSGIEALKQIRRIDEQANVIMLTTFDDEEDVYDAVHEGARGYLLKETPGHEVVSAVWRVHQGHRCLPESVSERLAEHMERSNLTLREIEVLTLAARGQSNKQIAGQLGIATGTVKGYFEAILVKLDAGDRTEAVTVALRRGALRLDRL